MLEKSKIIAIDFDGTLVEHEYPEIGLVVPFANEVLWELKDAGYRLMLYTMRDGVHLEEAVDHCEDRGIKFWAINKNPEQASWTTQENKQYAHLYIDDAALGIPLIHPENKARPYVDWRKVRDLLSDLGYLPRYTEADLIRAFNQEQDSLRGHLSDVAQLFEKDPTYFEYQKSIKEEE